MKLGILKIMTKQEILLEFLDKIVQGCDLNSLTSIGFLVEDKNGSSMKLYKINESSEVGRFSLQHYNKHL